jgi:hypothetical protein
MALALVIFGAIRGGLLNVAANGSALNPYAIVAIAAVVGMFSLQIIDRLRERAGALTGFDADHAFELPGDATQTPRNTDAEEGITRSDP